VNGTALSRRAEVANTIDVQPDPGWHDSAVLLGELATLNTLISRYITATLDADAKRGRPISPTQEAALAQELIGVGERLRNRTQRLEATRLPAGRRVDHPTRGEVNDMDETNNSLVVGVTSTPVVQDRTEVQLSDGMDDGETRDPV
jgi:hypothetical protein